MAQAIEAYWDAQKNTTWFQNHPLLSCPATRSGLVCSGGCGGHESIHGPFHGDDADSHRRRNFYVATVSSPLCEYECSWDSRLLCCCLDNSRCLPETFDVLDQWLVYSFTELQEGKFFTVDAFGAVFERGKAGRVCGGYKAVLVGIKGDEKFIQRTLKVTASWISDGVCMYCAASQGGNNIYTKFGPAAPHRSTLVDNEQFFSTGCRGLRLPGIDVSRIYLDWLHIVDLALCPEASASVSWLQNSSGLSIPGPRRAHKQQHGLEGARPGRETSARLRGVHDHVQAAQGQCLGAAERSLKLG